MEPVAYEGALPAGSFSLGDFAFVMGKYQVRSPAMDIDRCPQKTLGHGGTFDVPAWAARTPGAGPCRLSRLSGLPEGKIEGMACMRVIRLMAMGARQGQHVLV